MEINCMRLQENSALTDTVLIRVCRSKRKRIVKKWLKNEHNYKTVPSQHVYIFQDERLERKTIVCHPVMAGRIKEAMRLRGRMIHDTVDNQPGIIGYSDKKIGDVPTILQDKYKISEQHRNFA